MGRHFVFYVFEFSFKRRLHKFVVSKCQLYALTYYTENRLPVYQNSCNLHALVVTLRTCVLYVAGSDLVRVTPCTPRLRHTDKYFEVVFGLSSQIPKLSAPCNMLQSRVSRFINILSGSTL
jgi:hypothetical protein